MSVESDIMDGVNLDTYEGLEDLAGGDEKLQEILKNLIEGTKTASSRPNQQLLTIHWSVYILAFSVIFGLLGKFIKCTHTTYVHRFMHKIS